jgi:monoamine oxidase
MNVIIVGGGLSGLTLAYLLSKKNINTTVLEASSEGFIK